MSSTTPSAAPAQNSRSQLRVFLDNLREDSPALFGVVRGGIYAGLTVFSYLIGAVRRGGQYRRYAATHTSRKLHVGCGGNVIRGWFNTDRGAVSRDIAYLNATKPFPFPDRQFDYVFSEHMIEHIPFRAGVRLVKECFRVLKPGGKLRISTPDLERILALQRDSLTPLEQAFVTHVLKEIPGAVGPHAAYAINHYVRAWGHLFIYDKKVLADVFRHCGFVDVVAFAPGESDDPELRGIEHHGAIYPHPDFNLVESMVIQGTKPEAG